MFDIFELEANPRNRLLNAESDSLITAAFAAGLVFAEWSYHVEWEVSDIWPRVFWPALAAAVSLATAVSSRIRTLWLACRRRGGKRRTAATPAGAEVAPDTPASEKTIPAWALHQHPAFPVYKPLNGPEWAYVVARIGSIGCALCELAIHVIGDLGVGPESESFEQRWQIPDRNCSAARRLEAIFSLFALSGSGAIILVRALALHKFQRQFEKPILWALWMCLQALVLFEIVSIDAVSSHDGTRFCVIGPRSLHVPNVVILLPYVLPIASSTLCFIMIARYLLAYRRANPAAWRTGWTFRLYLRDSFWYWVVSIGVTLPLLILYTVQQVRIPGLFTMTRTMELSPNLLAEVLTQRWRLKAIRNLVAPITAAYACRIFVNLRRCLEHDLGGGGPRGATGYGHGATAPGGGAGATGVHSGRCTGGQSRARVRTAALAESGAGGAFTASAAPVPQLQPYPYQYTYPYPHANFNPTQITRGTRAQTSDHVASDMAANSPMYSQISRMYGGEQAVTPTVSMPGWAGTLAAPMPTQTAAAGLGPTGGTIPAHARHVRRPSTGGAVGTSSATQPYTLPPGTSALPSIHQQLAVAESPGLPVDQTIGNWEMPREYPQLMIHTIWQQQQQAAVTGGLIQAMNASGLPIRADTALLPPPATLSERQLVVVQEDWGDTHPDLVFSLNGGIDGEEEDVEEMQRILFFQQQQQLHHQQQQQQQQQQQHHPGHPNQLNGPLGPMHDPWWMRKEAEYVLQMHGVPAGTTISPSHPTTQGQVGGSLSPPITGPSASTSTSALTPALSTTPAGTSDEATNTDATTTVVVGGPKVAGDDDDDDDSDQSWMHHPEECECDGCCETDTEASDYVRPSRVADVDGVEGADSGAGAGVAGTGSAPPRGQRGPTSIEPSAPLGQPSPADPIGIAGRLAPGATSAAQEVQ
ncbi:hypothetical protein V8E36_005802 [Tilletia maclaganii]